jgi:hypothetical protein
MKRSITWIISIWTFCGICLTGSAAMAVDGPLANATVSFGQFETVPPLDRFFSTPTGGVGVSDLVIPDRVNIKAGGAINFIIGGGHVVAIYKDGTQPEDINRTNVEPPPVPQNAGGIISDSSGRIYRGNTNVGRNDGVEVVQFSQPGTYLVICARRDHFFDPATQQFQMFGFVKVLPGK